MNVTTAGIDLAKNVFSVHGVDAHGKVALKKTLSRGKLLEFFANLPPCIVGMEACSGAFNGGSGRRPAGHGWVVDRRILGLCCRWVDNHATSAMWPAADGGSAGS